MIYNTPVVEAIRKFEREKARTTNYTLQELETEIKKYSRRVNLASTYILASLASFFEGICLAATKEDNSGILITYATPIFLSGFVLGWGKISAIKADAYILAKENLENKIQNKP